LGDILLVALGSFAWLALSYATLIATRSKLPNQILRRKEPGRIG
jgi:hypothetical protein